MDSNKLCKSIDLDTLYLGTLLLLQLDLEERQGYLKSTQSSETFSNS